MSKLSVEEIERKVNHCFKATPLTVSKLENVVHNLKQVQLEAFDLFKKKEYPSSAIFYKCLLKGALNYYPNITDEEGKLGNFIHECITYFSESLNHSKEGTTDLGIVKDTLELYLKEDFGFSDEIAAIMLAYSKENEIQTLEDIIDRKLSAVETLYDKDKLIYLLAKLFRKYHLYEKFFDTIKRLSAGRWEKYIMPAEVLTSQGRFEEAKEFYEEGLKKAISFTPLIERKYGEFKIKMEAEME